MGASLCCTKRSIDNSSPSSVGTVMEKTCISRATCALARAPQMLRVTSSPQPQSSNKRTVPTRPRNIDPRPTRCSKSDDNRPPRPCLPHTRNPRRRTALRKCLSRHLYRPRWQSSSGPRLLPAATTRSSTRAAIGKSVAFCRPDQHGDCADGSLSSAVRSAQAHHRELTYLQKSTTKQSNKINKKSFVPYMCGASPCKSSPLNGNRVIMAQKMKSPALGENWQWQGRPAGRLQVAAFQTAVPVTELTKGRAGPGEHV